MWKWMWTRGVARFRECMHDGAPWLLWLRTSEAVSGSKGIIYAPGRGCERRFGDAVEALLGEGLGEVYRG
jgi:hypothetical protein